MARVRLSSEMKEMIERVGLALIATCDRQDVPNAAPKGSIRVLDNQHLLFNEATGGKTWANLKENRKIAVAMIDYERGDGFQLKGEAELIKAGRLYDQAVEMRKAKGKTGPLMAVVKVKIEEIYPYR